MASDKTVEYIIKLQDQISGTLSRIEKNTHTMNKAMEHSENVVGKLKTAFIEFFAIEKAFEFGKESLQVFRNYNVAAAQLDSILKSTGGTIGLTREKLHQLAEAQAKVTLYTKQNFIAAEEQLAMFTNVRKEIAERTIPIIGDVAARMKIDLSSAAHIVGMALNDPTKAARLLRQEGIALSDQQKNQLKVWSETGQMAKAQSFLLDELSKRTKGAAASAAAADPYGMMLKRIEEVQIKVGHLINNIMVKLAPSFGRVFDAIEPIIDSLGGILMDILPSIFNAISPIISAFKTTWSMVMLIIHPIINVLKPAFETVARIAQSWWQNISPMMPFLSRIAVEVGHILAGAIQIVFRIAEIISKVYTWLANTTIIKGIFTAIMWVVEKVVGFIEKIIQGIKWLLGIKDEVGGKKEGIASPEDIAKEGESATGGGAMGMTPSSVMESKPAEAKNTQINITINGGLVHDFKIVSQNMTQSAGQLKELIVKTMLGAVNDFNLVPGQ